MAGPLTHNAVLSLCRGDWVLQPVLQVADVKQIGDEIGQDRFHLLLSDGEFLLQAILGTQLNEYVNSNEVVRGTIVQLEEYVCNTIVNRKIIIVLNMEVVETGADIIGDPRPLLPCPAHLAAAGGGDGQLQPRHSPGDLEILPRIFEIVVTIREIFELLELVVVMIFEFICRLVPRIL